MAREANNYFVWRDGLPYPVVVESYTKASAVALVAAAAANLYKPKNDSPDEQRFANMTLMEVTMVRLAEKAADGNYEAAVHMLDRLAGKPKQETQNITMNVTYQDYLDKTYNEHSVEIEAEYQKMIAPLNKTQDSTIEVTPEAIHNNLGDL